MNSACSIRVFVRNKSRYNPASAERNLLFVDVSDFAGTTIGEVKEVDHFYFVYIFFRPQNIRTHSSFHVEDAMFTCIFLCLWKFNKYLTLSK